MAATRTFTLRWFQRYRPYFAIFAIFLIIQILLALSFYRFHENVEEQNILWGNTGRSKGNVQLTHKDARQRNSLHDSAMGKLNEDYVIDDEDAPSNMFEKAFKDSSSRNISPKDAEKQKLINVALPAAKDLQNLRIQPSNTDKSNSIAGNGTKKHEEALNLDELDFKPWCNITVREAISAIHRATTQACKHELANITCLMQQKLLYPERLPRYCPLEGSKPYSPLGCFKDQSKNRILSSYAKKLANNSPTSCADLCLQSGFQYAGVQYGSECFCGKKKPAEELKLDDSKCNMPCPKNSSVICGGYYAMNVYNTGLPKIIKQEPKPSLKEKTSDYVRIVFLLTVNGRAVRQVLRLIKALFHERHFFYIHVDSRQDYLYRELKILESSFSNIKLSQIRLSTIWGGASLLQMLLGCISELLHIKSWSWDYVINLSESDFPIKSLTSLQNFLTANQKKNFVKSHGQDTQRFIAKQGLDKTFYECDTHMWRLGDRVLPWGIRVDGGSDWVALHRNFCSYVIHPNNTLLEGLMTVFRYTLLPAESFFHTVLQNSEFCETVIDNNLHVTNWKRKQGCKCQYKHIVDWCGCSPNDFKPEDWPRLQATEDRPYFFARKFEPIINQQIIEQLETWIYGSKKGAVTNMDSYWQNDYHAKDKSPSADDARLSIYESFARLGIKQLRGAHKLCKAKLLSVSEATLYNVNDVFKGILVLFEALLPNVQEPVILETQVRPIQHYSVYKAIGPTGRLKLLQVGSDFDLKEQVFRNLGRILGPFSEPGALHRWGSGPAFSATFVWVDPANTVAGSYEVKIDAGSQVLYHKPTFRQPLCPGIWTLKLLYNWVLVAETLFLITPLALYSGHRVTSEQVKFLHNGPGQPYIDHDFTNVETILGYTNKSVQTRQALANSRRFGKDLSEWTDSLVSGFWGVQDTCFIAQPQHPTGGVLCPELDLDPCHLTLWSSRAPDPKSDLSSMIDKAS